MTEQAELSLDDLAGRMDSLRSALATVIVGQELAVDQLLAALLAGGHVLLEGVPGVAKTLLARSLSEALGLQFKRVQFTPDLMPADIVGSSLFDFQDRSFRLQKGPVFTQVLLADEINRTPPKTQAALLEAMEERQATIDGTTHRLPSPFFVIATQNPMDHEGTYPLPEAQLDRFLLKVVLDYPSAGEELEIYQRFVSGRLKLGGATRALQPVFAPGEVARVQALLDGVHVEAPVLEYLRDLVGATRRSPVISAGASPRAGLAWLAVARARAAMDGRSFVIPQDLTALAGPVLRHRLLLTPEAELEGQSTDEVLEGVVSSVQAPR